MAYVTAAHSIVKALQGDKHGSHTVQQHQYASCTMPAAQELSNRRWSAAKQQQGLKQVRSTSAAQWRQQQRQQATKCCCASAP
jgi:hypothetical protein